MSMSANGNSSSNTGDDKHDTRLPQEMYEHIISHMENRDLKNARLISQGWKDFATPHLFRHAVFSLVAENVANLRKLADSDLGRHIERLHLDATAFVRTMTPSTYADYMSHWFAKLLQMEVPICGPLCQGNLLYVLRSDLSAPLTADHLQGAARTAFAAGYTLYSGRIEAQQVWIGKDQLYTAMDYIVARLPKLKHLETVTGWGSLPNREDHFKLWLKQNLPRETYDLIGLHDGPDRDLPRLPYSGIFETPGIASRMLHPMTVCPARALLPMQSEIAPLVVAALRALRGNKIKLETLKLPGCDAIGSLPVPWQRQGMVPVPALIGVPASMLSTYQTLTDLHKENLLLPVFKNLKSLDLQIDHTHPGFRGFYEFDSDYYRLPRAILSMKRIESLALGMQSYEHCAIQEYDVSALDVGSVFFDRSAATEEGEEGSNLPPQPPGPPPDISNLFASLAQAFGVPVSGHGSGSFAPVPASQSAVGSLGPQGPLTVPPNQGNFQPHVSVSVDDMIGAEAMDKSFPEFYDDDPWLDDPGLNLETNAAEHPKQWISEEPLVPNPWPMLRSLALWNMPTTKPDLMRLIKTVKDSLQELTLINVYYERPTRQREAEGTIAAGIQGANALFNQHSHNTPSSLPGWPTHQLVAVAPSPMFLGPGGQQPASAPLATLPEEGQGQQDDVGSELPSGSSNDELWYATADSLSDILHLKQCNIRLSPEDLKRLHNKLAAQIDGFEETEFTIDQFVTEYVLSGEGVGLAFGVAETVMLEREKKVTESSRASTKKDAESLTKDFEDWRGLG